LLAVDADGFDSELGECSSFVVPTFECMRDYFEVISSAEWVLIHAYFHHTTLDVAVAHGLCGNETGTGAEHLSVRAKRQIVKRDADVKRKLSADLEQRIGGMCGTATVVFQTVAR
jgi:hypothetical protein